MKFHAQRIHMFVFGLALLLTLLRSLGVAATVTNPICTVEEAVFYGPGNGEDIIVPAGFKVSVFAKDLNFPVGIAFRGNQHNFQVYVLESGHGLPSRATMRRAPCVGGKFSPTNPLTPDILVFDQKGKKILATLAKPTRGWGASAGTGPSIGIGFEHGFSGGRLFVTDSNQAIRTPGAQNNSSRIVIVNPTTRRRHAVHHRAAHRRPSGASRSTFKSGWIYWSQGSTTNSGVVGRDNGGRREPARHPVSGHRAQQQRVRLRRRRPHQRLLALRHHASRGHRPGVSTGAPGQASVTAPS